MAGFFHSQCLNCMLTHYVFYGMSYLYSSFMIYHDIYKCFCVSHDCLGIDYYLRFVYFDMRDAHIVREKDTLELA